jgi:hypothetical protein
LSVGNNKLKRKEKQMDSFKEEKYLDKIDAALRAARKKGLISLRDMWAMQDKVYSYDSVLSAWFWVSRRISQLESDYKK